MADYDRSVSDSATVADAASGHAIVGSAISEQEAAVTGILATSALSEQEATSAILVVESAISEQESAVTAMLAESGISELEATTATWELWISAISELEYADASTAPAFSVTDSATVSDDIGLLRTLQANVSDSATGSELVYTLKIKLVDDAVTVNEQLDAYVVKHGTSSDAATATEHVHALRDPWRVDQDVGLHDVARRMRPVSLSQDIGLQQNQYPIRVIISQLTLAQSGRRVLTVELTQDVGLVSADEQQSIKHVPQDVGLTDVRSTAGSTWLRTVSQDMGIVQGYNGWAPLKPGTIAGACDQWTGLGLRLEVTLTWPYVAPTLTVNLRVPKFGNGQRIDRGTVVQRVRGGQLKSFQGSAWPLVETFKYAFEALAPALRDDVVAFIEAAAGDEIGLLDHENRQWRGVLGGTVTFVETGRGCQHDLDLEFTGRLA